MRSIFAAWRRGDSVPSIGRTPKSTFVIADGPGRGSWSGAAAMAPAWREALSAFEHLRAEADEYRALDDERVFVLMHLSGRGKASSLEVGDIQMKGANLFHLRDGKVTRLVLYWDRQHATPTPGCRSRRCRRRRGRCSLKGPSHNPMARDDAGEEIRHCDADVLHRPAQARRPSVDRTSARPWNGGEAIATRASSVTEELLDTGDRVVLTIFLRGRGSSGAEIGTRFYEVFKLRGCGSDDSDESDESDAASAETTSQVTAGPAP